MLDNYLGKNRSSLQTDTGANLRVKPPMLNINTTGGTRMNRNSNHVQSQKFIENFREVVPLQANPLTPMIGSLPKIHTNVKKSHKILQSFNGKDTSAVGSRYKEKSL